METIQTGPQTHVIACRGQPAPWDRARTTPGEGGHQAPRWARFEAARTACIEFPDDFPFAGVLRVDGDAFIVPAAARTRPTRGWTLRGLGPEALRRQLVNELLGQGFEVTRADATDASPVPGRWQLHVSPAETARLGGRLEAAGSIHVAPSCATEFDATARDHVRIGSGTRWGGTLAAGTGVVVGRGALVEGDVVSRGPVRLNADARVLGTVTAAGLDLDRGAAVVGRVLSHATDRRATTRRPAPMSVTSLLRSSDRLADEDAEKLASALEFNRLFHGSRRRTGENGPTDDGPAEPQEPAAPVPATPMEETESPLAAANAFQIDVVVPREKDAVIDRIHAISNGEDADFATNLTVSGADHEAILVRFTDTGKGLGGDLRVRRGSSSLVDLLAGLHQKLGGPEDLTAAIQADEIRIRVHAERPDALADAVRALSAVTADEFEGRLSIRALTSERAP